MRDLNPLEKCNTLLTKTLGRLSYEKIQRYDKAKKKKKENCCDTLKRDFWIFESVSWKIVFNHIFFPNSTQKFKILVHFFTFFLKKGGKTPDLKKMGAFPTLIFLISFFEMGRSLRATQHFFFLGLPRLHMWPSITKQHGSRLVHVSGLKFTINQLTLKGMVNFYSCGA